MASQALLDKMESRKNFCNLWHTDLVNTTQDDPIFCCLAAFCAPCVSYTLRKRALYDNMSNYVCCAGYMPCSGRCAERKCPELCLATEVCLCFANSVASTRFLLQDQFNIQTTACDNCIIGFMLFLKQVACVFSLVAMCVGSDEISEASQILNVLSDMVYCTVCACMQTQHKIEMDKRDGKLGPLPVMVVPPIQEMSRIDRQVPPTVGYAPQPGYGQPYGYPEAQGYPPSDPPSGYPPSAYPPSGYSPSAYPPSSYPPPSAYPPSGYPPSAYPPSGYPPSAYPPSGYPPSAYPPSGYIR